MNKEEFLKLAEAKYEEINALKEAPTFFDYERGFAEIWTELGRQVIQTELGMRVKTVVKKNIQSTFGTLHLSKGNEFIVHMQHDIAISPLLQSHMLEFANEQPFERAMELLGAAGVLPIFWTENPDL